MTLLVVALAIGGSIFVFPALAHPYWSEDESGDFVPPMGDEAGYNGTYGPWHLRNRWCPWWNGDSEGNEPESSYPPWYDPDNPPEEEGPGWQSPGSVCGGMGQWGTGPRWVSHGHRRGGYRSQMGGKGYRGG